MGDVGVGYRTPQASTGPGPGLTTALSLDLEPVVTKRATIVG
jgi:hypothetical protein